MITSMYPSPPRLHRPHRPHHRPPGKTRADGRGARLHTSYHGLHAAAAEQRCSVAAGLTRLYGASGGTASLARILRYHPMLAWAVALRSLPPDLRVTPRRRFLDGPRHFRLRGVDFPHLASVEPTHILTYTPTMRVQGYARDAAAAVFRICVLAENNAALAPSPQPHRRSSIGSSLREVGVRPGSGFWRIFLPA